MKKLMTILALVVLIGSNFFGHSLMNAMAEEPAGPEMSRCYKSITIQEGDSLWAIAQEYSCGTQYSVKEYVAELKKMNGLKEDTIHAGNHLTVMYLVAAE